MTHLKTKIAAAAIGTMAVAGMTLAAPAMASAAPAKPAIDTVPCDNSDYLQVWWHQGNDAPRTNTTCFANAGTFTFPCVIVGCWLDAFSTGNNTVEYEADNTWQPSTPVGKYTYFTFPNHPGGVDLEAIQIF